MPPSTRSIHAWFSRLLTKDMNTLESPCLLLFPLNSLSVDVQIETPGDLQTKLLADNNAVDHLENIYASRISYYKIPSGAQHEFLIVHIRDATNPSRKNVMMLDRVPRQERTTPPTYQSVLAEGIAGENDEADTPKAGSWQFRLSSKPSSSVTLSQLFGSLDAFDRFVISTSNNLKTLCSSQDLNNYEEIESLEIDHQDLSLARIIVLAKIVSAHRPTYHLYRTQCYWYASVVWDVACTLAFPGRSFEKSLKRRTTTILRFMTICPPINESDRPEAIFIPFEQGWQEFSREAAARKGRGALSLSAKLQAKDAEVLAKDAEIRAKDVEIQELRRQLGNK